MPICYTETDASFSAPDGKTIYATEVKSLKVAAPKALIIFVHGYACSRDAYTYLNAARLFARKGFDSLRLSLYESQTWARTLTDCTLEDHVSDIDTAIKKYKRRYKNIFLIGHSFAGVILMQKKFSGIRAMSLWDPSYMTSRWAENFRKVGSCYALDGGIETLLSPRMRQQMLAHDQSHCRELAQKNITPVQVLHSMMNGTLYKLGESYHTFTAGPSDYHTIAEADHFFLAEAAQTKAVAFTGKWFDKFLYKETLS